MNLEKLIDKLKNKRILILGLAKEGIDTLKFLRKVFPNKVLGVGDRKEIFNFQLSNFRGAKVKVKMKANSAGGKLHRLSIFNLLKKDKKIKVHLGENYLKALKNYDIIIKSPGIPIHLSNFRGAKKKVKMKANSAGGKLHRLPEVDEAVASSPPFAGTRVVDEAVASSPPFAGARVVDEIVASSPPFARLRLAREIDEIVASSPPFARLRLAREIERAFKKGKITSQTEIFFENCPGKIIGITGTKGKGTTASLIYQILKKGGLRANLVGNIGKPALAQLLKARPDTIFVYELSSHQLYNLKKSPQIAVLLNIFPAHLEYFRNFREYINAKANIARYQTKDDYLIYNPEDKIVKEIIKKSKAQKTQISTKLPVLRKIKIPLIGKFNRLNLAAAVIVAKLFKVSDKDITKAIKNFKPSVHRLEYVGTFKGIKFYNDSASTVPESTIGAIESLKEKLQTVILGGSECKVSFQKLAKEVLKSKIKALILFPTTGQKIWRNIIGQARGKTLPKHFFVSSMAEAVKLAYSQTKRGGICLLSPASPSFSLFHDYKERGDLFKKYTRTYGKKRKKSS